MFDTEMAVARKHSPLRRTGLVLAWALAVLFVLLAGALAWQLGIRGMTATSVADKGSPSSLSPELLKRFDRAQAEANAEGIDLTITSGWRSAQDQQRIYEEKVAEIGVEEARKQVLPPSASAHVAGTAIDVAPYAGAVWLERESRRFGLCRTYANEWWHFEVVGGVGDPCPDLKPDASVDW